LFHEGRYLRCNKVCEVLKQVWVNYPENKIGCVCVKHAQVDAAIYDCNTGNELIHQHKGLSVDVRRVYRLYYGKNNTGEEVDLTSLAPRTLANAKGVLVEELEDGIDFNGKEMKLKDNLPICAHTTLRRTWCLTCST
jgi:hypothetical protein